ncbi:MAG: cytochrome P450 [Novosphingobium sp.]
MATTAPEPTYHPHVPGHLLWDNDFNDFCHEGDDPHVAAARLIGQPPVILGRSVSFGRPAWILTNHAAMEQAFLSPHIFSNQRGGPGAGALGETAFRMIPVELDPPEHGKYRRILHPYFTPQSTRRLDGMVQETCDALIGQFAGKGGCEFIADFGSRLPNLVFLRMMGLPEDMLDQFLVWEKGMIHGKDDATRTQSTQAVLGYLGQFIAEQRKAPGTELMHLILNGEVDGKPMRALDVLGTVFLLYVGGLDTVYSSLGFIFNHLARDPALQQRLRNHPADMPKAVDEFTRAFPVARPTRTVAQDCEFLGAPLRKGDLAVLPTYIAGRDPAVYADPHRIDIDRKARSITFATGPHLCLGIHLAKREIRTALEGFLQRFRDIRIPAGETWEYHTGGVLGVDRLPLEWRVG